MSATDREEEEAPGGCPGEHDFSALLQGTLDEEERRRLHDHADRCARCAELLDDLGRMLASAPGPGERAAAARAGRGERVGGRYELLRLVGAGGMGAVHEAHDEALGRKVAIKLLRPDLLDPGLREDCSARLVREARLLAAVHHPNVLAIYDVGRWKDQVFLAIQYVEGTTLGRWIEQQRPSWQQILAVYTSVGSGLAEAHRLQLVHRDIKPDNILIDPGGRAWLADFGLACAIGAGVHVREASAGGDDEAVDPYRSAITRSGSVLGTPAYMAPEQHQGLEVDARADQFSFCASLYESLAGVRPFPGASLREVRAAACAGPRPSRPSTGRGEGVPAALWGVLARGMAARPSGRFASMNELLAALAAASTRRPAAQRAARALGWALAIGAGGAAVSLGTLAAARRSTAVQPLPAAPPGVSASASASASALTEAQKNAATMREVKALHDRCRDDPAQCDPLVARLKSCCISTSLEGVMGSDIFRAGTQGLIDRFEKSCESDPSACSLAAYAWTHSFHDSDSPEGEMIPRFMALMEKGCERGDFLSCAAIRDVYGSGHLKKDASRFAVKPSIPKLISLLGAGCDRGNGQICWLLVESLHRNAPAEVTRSLQFAEKSCERGQPLACLLAGLQWRALGPEQCQEDLRSFFQSIPDNDVLDPSTSWSDLVTFCKRAAAFQDDRKAAALWDLGCKIKDEPQSRGSSAASRKKSSRLCCERRRTLEPSTPPTAD